MGQRGDSGDRDLFGPRFELFADVLSIGLATAVASLPIFSAPAALSTACALLRRHAATGSSVSAGRYARVLAARLRSRRFRGDLLAGATAALAGVVLVADLLVARSGLPGAAAVTSALLAASAAAIVVGLRAAALPQSASGWRAAVRAAGRASAADLSGSALLFAAACTAALCMWMLPFAAALVPGPLALAATAVEIRRTGELA